MFELCLKANLFKGVFGPFDNHVLDLAPIFFLDLAIPKYHPMRVSLELFMAISALSSPRRLQTYTVSWKESWQRY